MDDILFFWVAFGIGAAVGLVLGGLSAIALAIMCIF